LKCWLTDDLVSLEFERHHISELIVALNWRREKDELFVAEMLVSREGLYRNYIHVRKKIRLIGKLKQH